MDKEDSLSHTRWECKYHVAERVNSFETQVTRNYVAIACGKLWTPGCSSSVLAAIGEVAGSSGLIATTAGGRAALGHPRTKRCGCAAYAAEVRSNGV